MLQAFFDPENGVWRFINKCLDLAVLSLIFCICCIPVVTIGPACAALYYAVVKSVREGRSYCVREFMRGFCRNLKKGILINLVLLALLGMMLAVDVPLMLSFGKPEKLGHAFCLVLLLGKSILVLGMGLWIFPLLSCYEESVLKLAEAALYLVIRHFPITLWNLAVAIVSILLLRLEPLLAAVVPGIAVLVGSFSMEPLIRAMSQENAG